jgi:crotonobetainyl-CoA:carnitine CoA-transferase CaiB-like acyl-CoA transferase
MGILDGIRIVDLTTGLSGPAATRLLAEQGADVIKVEGPGGDLVRGTAAFATWNRSKSGVVLDIDQPEGRRQLQGLLATADVLVHGLRPSKALSVGLDAATLASSAPDLIVCTVGGFPIDHPDAERPGYDILIQARSGAMDEVWGARRGPIFLRLPVPSWATMYLVASGILARLIVRDRSGQAGPVHTSLYQGMMAVLTMLWNRAEHPTPLLTAKAPLQKGTEGTPGLSMFECACGGWLQTQLGYSEHPLIVETLAEMGEEPIEIRAHAYGSSPRDPAGRLQEEKKGRVVAGVLRRRRPGRSGCGVGVSLSRRAGEGQ